MYMDNLKNGEKEVWCLFLTSNHDTSLFDNISLQIAAEACAAHQKMTPSA